MKPIFSFLLILLSLQTYSQSTLSGRILDREGNGVPFANIYLEGSYDGATSDTAGFFTISTQLTGMQQITVSCIGYESQSFELDMNGDTAPLQCILRERISELNEVSITAGVFSASDKKKSVTLTAMDISTTPSAVGDVYGAFAALPGSQKVGEEGMLFVRGGEAYETKTYMDGMLVRSPYFSSLPRIPTRGRFSPLLFSETVFSTGGYSAEYGNALSSIVDLTTTGLEPENKASISLMTVGTSASYARRWENTSLAMTGLYADNTLNNILFKQNVDWIRAPVLGDGMVMFRRRLGETGLLKSFLSFNSQLMEMNFDNFEAGSIDRVRMNSRNLYANTVYTGEITPTWLVRAGVAYGRDLENVTYAGQPVLTTLSSGSGKLVLTKLAGERLKIRMGTNVYGEFYRQEIRMDSTLRLGMEDLQPSLFVEPEWKVSQKLAFRIGLRGEYSTLLREGALLPRISAAYKTGTYSQVSLAWGRFRQKPENDYLKLASGLETERADHYILNYQVKKLKRTFRVETYYKVYDHLVKYRMTNSPDPEEYSNTGYGNAAGVDLFWRDRETLKGADYWISYSFLHTRRDYR
ncbi:MAG: TonB-dependent receptor, partial [Bacteroidales bacterium]